jgi:hypothetical protein
MAIYNLEPLCGAKKLVLIAIFCYNPLEFGSLQNFIAV